MFPSPSITKIQDNKSPSSLFRSQVFKIIPGTGLGMAQSVGKVLVLHIQGAGFHRQNPHQSQAQ